MNIDADATELNEFLTPIPSSDLALLCFTII